MGSVHAFPAVDPADAAIGARLKRWRLQRAVGIETLAHDVGMPPEALRRCEAGHAHLNTTEVGALTARLHLPLWALVSDRPAY